MLLSRRAGGASAAPPDVSAASCVSALAAARTVAGTAPGRGQLRRGAALAPSGAPSGAASTTTTAATKARRRAMGSAAAESGGEDMGAVAPAVGVVVVTIPRARDGAGGVGAGTVTDSGSEHHGDDNGDDNGGDGEEGEDDEADIREPRGDEPSSPRAALVAELRESADRVSSARFRAEFEHSLLACLLFNVLYLYYIDYRLIVLVIRIAQIFRLLYFPHETPEMQRVTSALLVMSNIAVALIHGAILAEGTAGEMLLINFIGPEPNALAKLFYVDFVIVVLQCALTSIGGNVPGIVTGLPVACQVQADRRAAAGPDEGAEPTDRSPEQSSVVSARSDAQSDGSQTEVDDIYREANPLFMEHTRGQTSADVGRNQENPRPSSNYSVT